MEHGESVSARAALENAAKATLALLSELSQREARRDASLDRQIESLRQEVGQFRRDVASLVEGAGGSPYTPFDLMASQRNYLTTGVGTEDYTRLNSQRLKAFSRVDFRVDKKWNYKKLSIDLFFDFQNALLTANPAFPQYTFERLADNSGFKTTDGQALKLDGSNGIPLILTNEDSNFTPALGLVIEF